MKKLLLAFGLAAVLPVMAETNVLVFAGSLRENSYNKILAKEAVETAQKLGAKAVFIDLKDFPIPFYDADLEASQGMPENAKKLRDLMMASNVIVISTPEYNHSIPAVLKNALDWASRGENGRSSKEAFKGKRFALMSASGGKSGGKVALSHLKAVIEDCGGIVLDDSLSIPKAYEPGALESEQVKMGLQKELELAIR